MAIAHERLCLLWRCAGLRALRPAQVSVDGVQILEDCASEINTPLTPALYPWEREPAIGNAAPLTPALSHSESEPIIGDAAALTRAPVSRVEEQPLFTLRRALLSNRACCTSSISLNQHIQPLTPAFWRNPLRPLQFAPLTPI